MQDLELTLNRPWFAVADRDNTGKAEGWFSAVHPDAVPALVPGTVQDTLADFTSGVAWFYTRFPLSAVPEDSDAFLKLRFTDYITECYINGKYLGRFEGKWLAHEFPCADALQPGENLLALRLVMPGREEIEGYRWFDLPYLHDPEVLSHAGILYPVQLAFRPRIRVVDPVIVSDIHTGRISASFRMHSDRETAAVWSMTVLSNRREAVASQSREILLTPGDTVLEAAAELDTPRLWSPEDPYLYQVVFSICVNGCTVHTLNVTTGFRELTVRDGWFFLNGKRILVQGSFATPDYMEFVCNEEYIQRLIHTKSMGLNVLRFHNNVPRPELLDICDRIGLLVVCSHGASWGMHSGARNFEAVFDYHLTETVRQNINHPCIVAWELVNESWFTKQRQHSIQVLQTLRQVDMTRLVFLDSGRWDKDSRVGSISNPYSLEWECQWGDEDPNLPPPKVQVSFFKSDAGVMEYTLRDEDPVNDGNGGDWHYYPEIPLSAESKQAFRTHSAGHKPFFLSEFGTNSLGTALEGTRRLEQTGVPIRNEKFLACTECGRFLEAFFEKYNLGQLYPFPEDLVQASYRQAAYQRQLMHDLARSNPQMAGYLFSGMCASFSALAPLSMFKDRLPHVAEAIEKSAAPLRWCLFVEPMHVYAGAPFTVEAVLASADALQPGRYPVSARIVSREQGCVWSHKTELVIPETGPGEYLPLSFPVIRQQVRLAESGQYTCSVYLERDGAPSGGRVEFTVSPPAQQVPISIRAVGLEKNKLAWFSCHGVTVEESASVTVVGTDTLSDTALEALLEDARNGASVLFLRPEVFCTDTELRDYQRHAAVRLPFAEKGFLRYSANWAYRVYTVLKKHPFSGGLPLGLLDDAYFNMTEPIFVFEETRDPEEPVAVTLGAPYFDGQADEVHGTLSAVTLGVHRYGRGKLILSCFRILDQLEENPAAGKLLMNMLENM